ncbi:hypothetical protein DIPPA_32319 [Diplonema papillatum]|nr:hypothetical protein DIPPA_32319 [Diplonema papillatum]
MEAGDDAYGWTRRRVENPFKSNDRENWPAFPEFDDVFGFSKGPDTDSGGDDHRSPARGADGGTTRTAATPEAAVASHRMNFIDFSLETMADLQPTVFSYHSAQDDSLSDGEAPCTPPITYRTPVKQSHTPIKHNVTPAESILKWTSPSSIHGSPSPFEPHTSPHAQRDVLTSPFISARSPSKADSAGPPLPPPDAQAADAALPSATAKKLIFPPVPAGPAPGSPDSADGGSAAAGAAAAASPFLSLTDACEVSAATDTGDSVSTAPARGCGDSSEETLGKGGRGGDAAPRRVEAGAHDYALLLENKEAVCQLFMQFCNMLLAVKRKHENEASPGKEESERQQFEAFAEVLMTSRRDKESPPAQHAPGTGTDGTTNITSGGSSAGSTQTTPVTHRSAVSPDTTVPGAASIATQAPGTPPEARADRNLFGVSDATFELRSGPDGTGTATAFASSATQADAGTHNRSLWLDYLSAGPPPPPPTAARSSSPPSPTAFDDINAWAKARRARGYPRGIYHTSRATYTTVLPMHRSFLPSSAPRSCSPYVSISPPYSLVRTRYLALLETPPP